MGGSHDKHLRSKGPGIEVIDGTKVRHRPSNHVGKVVGMGVFGQCRRDFVAKVEMSEYWVPWWHGLSGG